jgi:hypothetical protein
VACVLVCDCDSLQTSVCRSPCYVSPELEEQFMSVTDASARISVYIIVLVLFHASHRPIHEATSASRECGVRAPPQKEETETADAHSEGFVRYQIHQRPVY